MKILAPAKVNLSLDIVGRRPDGYHDLDMVMQSVSLYDVVSVEKVPTGSVKLTCGESNVPCGGENTVLRAANAFFEMTGVRRETGLLFQIEKHIPSQAGLGGGSADAAAALRLLDQICRTALNEDRLKEIGLSVGADVPFCVAGGTARVQGIGEIVTPVSPMAMCNIVICRPDIGIATKKAYAAFDGKQRKVAELHTGPVLCALEKKNLRTLGSALGNAFEDVGVPPEIPEIEKEMMQYGAAGARMTGSGSAVFGLFEDVKQAESCRISLLKRYSAVFLCRPVPGQAVH